MTTSGAPGQRSGSGSDSGKGLAAGGLSAFVALSRPVNGLIAATAVLVGAFVAEGPSSWAPAALAACSAFAGAAACNALNDVFDRETDRVNRPGRPIASGALRPTEGLLFAIGAYLVALALAVRIGPGPFLLVTGWAAATAVYSVWLKGTPVLGNVVVSAVASSAFILGGMSAGDWRAAAVPFGLAALVNLARELVKDAEDVEGDARAGVRTLAVSVGVAPTLAVARMVVVLTMAAAPLPYALGRYGSGYAVVAVPIEALLVAALVALRPGREGGAALASRELKGVMLLGLAAFVLGTL